MAALVAIGLIVTCITPLRAQSAISPSVVELFTSQSCYSCPPAEAYLGRLAGRPDILALEFHVDYWNDLVYGLAGKWHDVHSAPAFTARQRGYAQRLANAAGGGVYTPQMVIDGRTQAVGSREADVEAALRAARQSPRLGVGLAARDAGKVEVRLSGADTVPAGLFLVRFKLREETKVRAGENRGKTLINHHIVTELSALGPAPRDGAPALIDVAPPAPGEGCAVLVQAQDGGVIQGPILGAALCPAEMGKAA